MRKTTLNSLVNVDRHSLVAILASEAEAAQRSVNSARQRTASQRAKRREEPGLQMRANASRECSQALQALEAAGLEFLDENGAGLGVRFRKSGHPKRK
jgi:hypothetical protein